MYKPSSIAPVMNRRRVIVLITLGMLTTLCILSVFFGGLPPWPLLMWFAVAYIFFCSVIARVKPFRGPYVEPMAEPHLTSWPR